MRWVVLLVLVVTACYRPSLDGERCVLCGAKGECPGEVECIGGICGGPATCMQPTDDGSIDVPVLTDGTPGRSCTLASFDATQPAALGVLRPDDNPASFTTDATGAIGVFKYTTTQIGLAQLGGTPGFMPVIEDGTVKHYAPHLAPEADEMFLQTDDPTSNTPYTFQVSYRVNESWSVPQPIELRAEGQPFNITGLDFPGTPTALSPGPRLMMYLRDPSVIVELRETGPHSEIWELVRIYTSASFGLQRIYHPQLSSDGKVVVFVGDAGGGPAIYASQRTEAIDAFGNLTIALRGSVGHERAHPFLSDDCRTLYYYDLGAGIVKHEL